MCRAFLVDRETAILSKRTVALRTPISYSLLFELWIRSPPENPSSTSARRSEKHRSPKSVFHPVPRFLVFF